MKSLKINFKVIIALILMGAIAYFAFDAVQTEEVSGTELAFVTSGVATINTTETVNLVATAPRSFTLTSSDTDLGTLRSVREGTGRDLRYFVEVELAQGRTELQVTRGNDVRFELGGAETINVTLAARDDEANRNILIGAGIACLIILGYVGYSTRETWMGMVRKDSKVGTPSVGTTSA